MSLDDLDLPFEEHGKIPMLDQAGATLCGGLVVRAATVEAPDGMDDAPASGKLPALVWDFVRADGTFGSPIMLVLTDEQMGKLRPLVQEAIATARRGAQGGS